MRATFQNDVHHKQRRAEGQFECEDWIKYVLGRGLPSSEKLAEYWFLTIFDSQGDPLKPLGPFGGSLRALRELISEGLSKQARNLIVLVIFD